MVSFIAFFSKLTRRGNQNTVYGELLLRLTAKVDKSYCDEQNIKIKAESKCSRLSCPDSSAHATVGSIEDEVAVWVCVIVDALRVKRLLIPNSLFTFYLQGG